MKLRVGLIGLGDHWETLHRPALHALSDRFHVAAICCEVAHKSELIAREFGAVAIDGFRAMLERNEIDAVLALAPDWVGPLPLLAACEAGKAVYSSVAFDLAPEQVEEIRYRVNQSGVAFMAELPRRYAPATIRLKELIATRLGQPRLIFCHERHSIEEQAARLRRGKYCPIVWRNLMEVIDWVCYLTDRNPSSVQSALFQNKKQCDFNEEEFEGNGSKLDALYQMLNLRFDTPDNANDSVMAQISVGHYIPQSWPDALSYRRPAQLQICCEKGTAFVDLPANLIWFNEAGQHMESLELEKPVGVQMLTNFHRAVTSLVRSTSDTFNAYRAMSVVLAAGKSIREGKRIPLSFTD